MPQVSAIIPLYNKARYIRRTLDSVLAQTYRDFEVIVVDDGSTDNGPDVVAGYDDSRVRMVRQANQGPGAARNRGLAESEAPYVAFLDADDEWMPEFLARTTSVLTEHPECDVAASAYLLGSKRTSVVPNFRGRGMTDGPWSIASCRTRKELRSAVYILHSSTTLCRRRAVEMHGGFYDKNHCTYGEDYYLWVQVLFNHCIYRLLEPLMWYHIEASELGVGSKSSRALEPVLTDPEPVRTGCPPEHRAKLEQWLAMFALSTAHELIAGGDPERAAWLVEQFPLMRTLGWDFRKLRVKLSSPSLAKGVRRLKTLTGIFPVDSISPKGPSRRGPRRTSDR